MTTRPNNRRRRALALKVAAHAAPLAHTLKACDELDATHADVLMAQAGTRTTSKRDVSRRQVGLCAGRGEVIGWNVESTRRVPRSSQDVVSPDLTVYLMPEADSFRR